MDELVSDLDPEAPLRQGDVLGFRNWQSLPPLERYAVVITADCDLAQGRADATAICLVIAPLEAWIRAVWSREEYQREVDLTLKDTATRLNSSRQNTDKNAVDLDINSVSHWIASTSTDEILSELSIADPKSAAKLGHQIDAARKVLQLNSTEMDYFESAVQARVTRTQKSAEDCRRAIKEKAANAAVASDRVDTFFLTGFVGPEDRSGYLVMLSQFRALPVCEVTASFPMFREDQNFAAYRFGRLQPPYKYAVAQRFAYMFQRIGLPNEHRNRHLSAAKAVWDQTATVED